MRRKYLFPLLLILTLAFGGLVATFVVHNNPELGLDLQGGVSVVLAPTRSASGEALDQSVSIIRERVDALGVAEPEIARQGDAIVVQLPGVENRERVLELVGQTAELRFRPVLGPPGSGGAGGPAAGGPNAGDAGGTGDTQGTGDAPGDPATGDPAAGDAGAGADESATGLPLGESAAIAQDTQDTTTTTAPEASGPPGGGGAEEPSGTGLTPREEDKAGATVVLADKNGIPYRLGPTLATGRVVESAQATIPQGQWMVRLTMRGGEEGIDLFNQAAAECFNRTPTCPTGRLAIVLDSVVQSAPNIQEPSFERDRLQISGQFSEDEAKDLALVLRYGSLPVELERQSVQTVSATLGEDSLRAGVIAGVVGLVLVALYMVLYYRALGVVVIVGLGVWGSLLYTIVSWLGETRGLALTLAGVTGIIVSVGVTVDSYVVYFERLKEEIKAGRTLRTSTERAFRRAFRTILAADISSFMGAAVLWWLTVGSVRGFAFFLGLSTVLDVIVAWFFTRPVVSWLGRSPVVTDMPVLGVARGLTAARSRTPSEVPAGAGR